jgi:LPXTG-motif cell wall-anchored protein
MRGRKWLAQALALVLALVALVAPAGAESLPVNLNTTFANLQSMGKSLTAAVDAQSVATARARAQEARTIGLSVRADLQAVLDSNPSDDFVRSRAQAVLDQLNEGLREIDAALNGPDAEVAGKVRAAEAQILEAVAELQPALGRVPQATATAQPDTLPSTGDDPTALPLMAAVGLALLALGGLSKMRGSGGLPA